VTTVIFVLAMLSVTDKGKPDTLFVDHFESKSACVKNKISMEETAKALGVELVPVMSCRPIALHPKT
jgi:hypothetical protein